MKMYVNVNPDQFQTGFSLQTERNLCRWRLTTTADTGMVTMMMILQLRMTLHFYTQIQIFSKGSILIFPL